MAHWVAGHADSILSCGRRRFVKIGENCSCWGLYSYAQGSKFEVRGSRVAIERHIGGGREQDKRKKERREEADVPGMIGSSVCGERKGLFVGSLLITKDKSYGRCCSSLGCRCGRFAASGKRRCSSVEAVEEEGAMAETGLMIGGRAASWRRLRYV